MINQFRWQSIIARSTSISDPEEREEWVMGESGDRLRVCSGCGAVIGEGYVIGGGAHYCSDACLTRAVDEGRVRADIYDLLSHAGEDGYDDNYWTKWDE